MTKPRRLTPRELVRQAQDLVSKSEFGRAIALLDVAEEDERDAGNAVDAARAATMAATLSRFLGDLDGAEARLARARAAPLEGSSLARLHAEEADLALARGRPGDAVARAVEAVDAYGGDPPVGPLRLEARARLEAGDVDGAAAALDRAAGVALAGGEHEVAIALWVQRAALVGAAGGWLPRDGPPPSMATEDLMRATTDVAAENDLADLTAAFTAGDARRARDAALHARTRALDRRDVIAYVGAALGLATADDALGDRVSAYTALATGLATVSDVIGLPAARVLFEPPLQRLRATWGEQAFEEVKHQHDERRRQRPG